MGVLFFILAIQEFNASHMSFLVVGLGNIGSEYADTRHNIGFMIADELAKRSSASFSLLRHAYYSDFKFRGKQVYVIKPTTYMNLSGKAVNYWMQELKIPLERVIVLVDDLALPFGTIRLKPKGSSAGHNGLKSIEALCGGQQYPRLRFGVGDNFPRGRQAEYVLSPFEKEEILDLPALIDRSCQMIESIVHTGIELTMTNFNR